MKFNLKMIAVAAAMVSAGVANAAPTTGTTNNGSLVIGAFNVATNAWYLRDTGVLLNSFLPNSVTTLAGDGSGGNPPATPNTTPVTGNKTPAAGLTLTKASAGYTNFGDSSFSTWLTGQTQSDVRWFVSAVDDQATGANASPTARKRFITAGTGLTPTNGQLDGYISSGNAGGLGGFYATGTNGAVSSTGTGAPGSFSTNFGLVADNSYLASLGSSVDLFYVVRSTQTASTTSAATNTQFGNATGFAKVSLAANGDFSYTLAGAPVSAVPVPAAAWLFGSGLLSFGAFVRRRTAK
jgi:hypothetical protein